MTKYGRTLNLTVVRILACGLVVTLTACGAEDLDIDATETDAADNLAARVDGAKSPDSVACPDGYLPFADFVDAVKGQAITLAWDDGELHRILFITNSYGVTTASYYLVHLRDGQPDTLEEVNGGSPLKLKTSEDQRYMVLTGPDEAHIGMWKYPFVVLLPMTESFLSTRRSPVRANLRWNYETSWSEMGEALGFLEDRP